MTRRRYETQALVGELKRERRNATWLVIAGLTILGFLAFYVSRIGGDPVPTVPVDGGQAAAPRPAPAPVAAPVPAPVVATPAPTEATLLLELPRAASVWIDGKLIGNEVKAHTQKLPPGKHSFRAKLGRKDVRHNFDAEVGRTYKATLDPKKKKWDVADDKP